MSTVFSPVLVGGLFVAVVSGFVTYRDATRVGVSRPRLWAGIVAGTILTGTLTTFFVSMVPLPGVLVLVLAGPVLYLFERDDEKHGDEPANPRVLSGSTDSHSETETDTDQ